MSNIKSLIQQRITTHTWQDTPIEQEKIDYILDCAYGAPSKNGIYPYTINALGDSPEATEFKDWLYWHDTWLVDGIRTPPEQKNSFNKRFNGQYRAPLLLMWSIRIPPVDPAPYWKHFAGELSNGIIEQILSDMTVSASFALLAAEEQGLKTGYGVCHSAKFIDTILGPGEVKVPMALGIGYADLDTEIEDSIFTEQFDHSTMINEVTKDGVVQGRQPKNLPQSFPTQDHFVRKRKPSKDILVNKY
tara:strand:- start:47 stop:784 length:738 start_codon:yes stop_codon:yes gene_type:complete